MSTSSWENSADAYARTFAHLCAGTVDEVVGRLGPSGDHPLVLDIGTGPGTVAAAAHANGFTVVAMDSDHSMIRLTAQRHPEIALARAALPRLPCADRSFDAVTANFVINHTPDPRAATRELHRSLRTGGLLVATIWTSQVVPLNQLWNDVMQEACVSTPRGVRLPVEIDFARTVDGFVGILVEAGFDQIDCHETRWIFDISPDELWVAVEAGIAVIGQTYLAQDTNGRSRMRAAYERIHRTRYPNGSLNLPSTALVASAARVRQHMIVPTASEQRRRLRPRAPR